MTVHIPGIQNSNLLRLKKILNYSISGVLLYALTFFLPNEIRIGLAAAAALIFTPFMLYTLYIEKRINWIIFFLVLVALPTLLFIIVSFLFLNLIWLNLLSLALFYFYFFILRFEVNSWAKENMMRCQYENEKQERKLELDSFMKRYE